MDIDGRGRVLIIDDDPVVTDVLRISLEDDYTLLAVNNAADGLAMAKAKSPDLILLDIKMPDMDGVELCRILKADRDTRPIPIIFVTALSAASDEAGGLEAGAVDYITKPLNPVLVRARVSTHMELKKHRDYLKALASVDPLTTIWNRRGFDEHFDREWRRAARHAAPIALIMLDIDCFKAYNDGYGHLAGDECLRQVAAKLRDIPRRGGDLVARFGGEEFIVILADTDYEPALVIGEKLRGAVESLRLPHAGSTVADIVTVSVGVATRKVQFGDEPARLLEAADSMVYAAKVAGRNRVVGHKLDGAQEQQPASPMGTHR